MFLNVAQIQDLVRRPPVQVGATGAQLRRRAGVAFAGRCGSGIALRRQLDQSELDIVDRERLCRVGVKALQRRCRLLHLRRRAAQRDRAAAPGDGDVERRLDLAQVGVERAAKIGQRAVVYGRELKLDGLRLQCVPIRRGA